MDSTDSVFQLAEIALVLIYGLIIVIMANPFASLPILAVLYNIYCSE